MKQFDLSVFIARCQPLHLGHVDIVRDALRVSDEVIILCGSSFGARSVKNPFTEVERMQTIQKTFKSECDDGRVKVYPIGDYCNDRDWTTEVSNIVAEHVRKLKQKTSRGEVKISLVGHKKHGDSSTEYLNWFPQWESVQLESKIDVNATDLRDDYFSPKDIEEMKIPSKTATFLTKFRKTNHFEALRKEWQFIKDYKRPYKNLPFPPIFVTVDSVVFCNGCILLIKRKGYPGKGLWALPGGFLDHNERIREARIRELKEETEIEVSNGHLQDCMELEKVFDKPSRSLRGRTITHAAMFLLLDKKELPRVKGGDDAEDARWVPYYEFLDMRKVMYSDHWGMVMDMVEAANYIPKAWNNYKL